MKIWSENGETTPNIKFSTNPTETGFTNITSVVNYFNYGIQYGLTDAEVVTYSIDEITTWATHAQSDKDLIIDFVEANRFVASIPSEVRDDIIAPYKGFKIFNTTTSKVEWWNASTWVSVSGGGSSKFSRSFYADNIDNKSGTFNTVVCASSASLSILYSRHLFKAFDKNIEEAIGVSFALPVGYTDGADLKVTLTTTNNTAAKGVRWVTGLTQPTATGDFSDDTDTEYLAATESTTTGWNQDMIVLTFSGTTITKGDGLTLLVYRDTLHVDDDLNGDAYLFNVLIEEV